MLQNTLLLSCHTNTLQEWCEAIYVSPMLGSEITYRGRSFQGAVPIPFKAPECFFWESAPLGYIRPFERTAFKQRGANPGFSTRLKMKAITGFSKLAMVLAGCAHLVIVFSSRAFLPNKRLGCYCNVKSDSLLQLLLKVSSCN